MINNNFKIVIPVYNAEKYIEHCLTTALEQSYRNFEIIVINDASTDKTGEIIDAIQKDFNFEVIHNKVNVTALPNLITGIKKICKNDNDIILTLDGDDSLFHVDVLKYLNEEIYQDPFIWLTYGQYVETISHNIGCTHQIPDTRTYRRSGIWCTSHLRTFKYHLWKRIKDEDFRDKNGNYYRSAYDNAITFPMVEMAGNKRCKFISEILYLYNIENPLNDHKVDVSLQINSAYEIRQKPCYQEIL